MFFVRKSCSTILIDCCIIKQYLASYTGFIMSLLHQLRSPVLNKLFHLFFLSQFLSFSTALNCHPLEHIFSNVFPVIIGFPFMKPHILTALLWLSIVIISTLNDHSGHHLPFLHSSELHDYHHKTYILLSWNCQWFFYFLLDFLLALTATTQFTD